MSSEPRTKAGRALWARGSNNWSEDDWVRKFGENIAAVEAEAALDTGVDLEVELDEERLRRAIGRTVDTTTRGRILPYLEAIAAAYREKP